jgi:hypothetical protein
MNQGSIKVPSFVAASTEDATVKIGATMQFFTKDLHSLSQMRLYSAKTLVLKDPRIEIINSSQLAPKILDISHIALPIAPDDAYFGQHGTYYGEKQSDYYFGELHHKNLLHRSFKRLTYNPDFYGMLKQIDVFLAAL